MKVMRAMLAVLATICLSGCSTAGYYWQSVSGHMQMLQAARPVAAVLADPQTTPDLKTRLALSQRIRSFAAAELMLPNNPSYTRFADLRRSAVVWNVVAAPEFSLTLKTWCFPVAGCVGYRGYFSQAAAQLQADQLKAEGFEVTVYGVPAYSTLGKLAWLGDFGADPLLNTFIRYPEGELARLIFHELAHQVLYAPDDTMFNESFATAVERLGVRRWLATQASQSAKDDYAALDARRQQFRALTAATRRDLAAIYASNTPLDQQIRVQAATKAVVLQKFRNDYSALKKAWSDTTQKTLGYDAWVAQANNASFGAQAAYDELVPGFEALFESQGNDWQRFYDAVRQLADLPKAERHLALQVKNQDIKS
jgi:predicted aminopeptidase